MRGEAGLPRRVTPIGGAGTRVKCEMASSCRNGVSAADQVWSTYPPGDYIGKFTFHDTGVRNDVPGGGDGDCKGWGWGNMFLHQRHQSTTRKKVLS